ncbi:hypothetical protein [Marinimicrobium locisalis]|uniref:hypothetical protein n=1 Tax=Marinimicrobium locisalis TaxID=546022 RepID=UPI003222174D
MATSKRRQNQMERQLIKTLTEACEVAKAEIPGFSWLTHDNGNQSFPAGLRVTWIFDTQADLDRALAKGDGRRMQELTQSALEQAGLPSQLMPACLQFDSEEACRKSQDGNWLARLAQLRRTRH